MIRTKVVPNQLKNRWMVNWCILVSCIYIFLETTVKLGDKEHFDKEQIGVKEPFPVTNCQFTS